MFSPQKLNNQKGLTPHLNAENNNIAKGGRHLSAGLTLVEALVTLVILSFGLIPSLAVISSSTAITSLIKNNLIAANLAQEGVEIIRGLRDANWFAGRAFDNGLQGNWMVQWNTDWSTNPPQAVGTNTPLKFDSSTGLFNYSTGVDTNFKRYVSIVKTADPCGCKLVVVSRVDWVQQGRAKTINVESHLFDWK